LDAALIAKNKVGIANFVALSALLA